jgi:hypothetical protein
MYQPKEEGHARGSFTKYKITTLRGSHAEIFVSNPHLVESFLDSCEISPEAKAVTLSAFSSFWQLFSTASRFKLPQNPAPFATIFRSKVESFLELLRGMPLDRSRTPPAAASPQDVARNIFGMFCLLC